MPTWTSNIPSQVKTYANVGAFPATGSVKTIYIAEDTDIAYYWTGSAYQSISIQDLSGLVPYTGATGDVDLGNNDLNAEGIKIKGTAGNGHLNLKHQSSNATAGGQETVIFAGADGEPRFKNDGNAIEQLASRQWVNLQGFITNVITALGFTPVPDTRTVNGKALSSNITLTPSDIGSPSGSGTSSGTNTGDETQTSILSKLGWFSAQINTASALVTTTSPTIVGQILIPANTYPSVGRKFEFNISVVKTSNAGQIILDAYLGPNSNNLAGSTRIATTGNVTLNSRLTPLRRKMNFNGTDLVGSNFSSGNLSDDVAISSALSSLAFDRTINNYLIFVVTLLNASDNAYLSFAEFKNF